MSYLRENEKEKVKEKVRARKAKAKGRKARKVKVKEMAKGDVLTVASQGTRRETAGQMSQIGIRMTMESTTGIQVSSKSLSNVLSQAHLVTQLQRIRMDNPPGENHLLAFMTDLNASL